MLIDRPKGRPLRPSKGDATELARPRGAQRPGGRFRRVCRPLVLLFDMATRTSRETRKKAAAAIDINSGSTPRANASCFPAGHRSRGGNNRGSESSKIVLQAAILGKLVALQAQIS